MDINLSRLEWSHIQTLLAVAETGSFSAAARKLGLTQPTVGRHISTVETNLGITLFTRRAKGMEPTQAAYELLEPAKAMRNAATQLELNATGVANTPGGNVRITSSVFMAHHALPPIIARLRREAPEISIELVPSDTTENLLYREADIAVRMVRPEQLDMITRFIGDIELALFGRKDYLDRVGRPERKEDLLNHDFVGYDRNEQIVLGFREAGYDIDREFFKVRCDNQTAYWELVRAGCGLGIGQVSQGRENPDLEEIPLDLKLPTLPVWLTVPQTIRNNPAIRKVWEILAEDLTEFVNR
ncbi:MAG: LysR family transcriptional regulator [Pseudomonadota bacterium]